MFSSAAGVAGHLRTVLVRVPHLGILMVFTYTSLPRFWGGGAGVARHSVSAYDYFIGVLPIAVMGLGTTRHDDPAPLPLRARRRARPAKAAAAITAASLGGQAVGPCNPATAWRVLQCATSSPATCDNLHQRPSEAMATRYKKPRSINTVSVGLLVLLGIADTCHLHLAGSTRFLRGAKGVLWTRSPCSIAQSAPTDVALAMINDLKKSVPKALRKEGVEGIQTWSSFFARSKEEVSIEAHFVATAFFR